MTARLRYPEYAPEGVATLRGFEHYLNTGTSLPAVLLEMVRLRVSQLNGCEFCTQLHIAELRKHNEPQSRIDAIAGWTASDAFTGKERAALAWAEALTYVQQTHAADVDYAAVQQFFREKDLVDLTLVIGSINLWNRLTLAFRPAWDPDAHARNQAKTSGSISEDSSEGTRPAVNDDGGKIAED